MIVLFLSVLTRGTNDANDKLLKVTGYQNSTEQAGFSGFIFIIISFIFA